jgi:hypothetical protein
MGKRPRLTRQQLLNKRYLGKTLRIKVKSEFKMQKQVLGNSYTVTGTCNFIGRNETLGWEHQVTLNRTPFTLDSFDNIEIID